MHFGSQPHVYWIESGLVASSATTDVDKVRWIGLFSRRTLLGSVRAIGHGKAAMTLMATAVTDVSGFAIPLELYARWVSENPERERAMTSRAVGRMVSSGLLERSGRTFVLKAVPPAARLWWDA